MTIYYIAVTSWDGSRAYTFDYIRPFLTKQKRDEALAKMVESAAYKYGNLDLHVEEGEVEDFSDEAVEGEVFYNPYPTISLDDCKDYDLKDGDKVRIIIVKEG